MKKKTKKYISYWIPVIVAVSGSWFVWKTWDKFDNLFGETAYIVAGIILLIAIVFGHFSFKKLVEKFK